MKCFLTFLGLAAAFTIAFSPAVRRAIFYRDQPVTPTGWEPKFAIGGRRVTREEFEAWPPAPVIDREVHVDQFGKRTA